ncbi:MAG: DUF3108 domain-containing protein [Nitrospirae bacterium]|nr:DUF3108 domain-containing protein [Nitrospirota bacterium]
MKRYASITVFLALYGLTFFNPCPAIADGTSLISGGIKSATERLDFEISWIGISVGVAYIERTGVEKPIIRTGVDSTGWISRVYKVEDRAYSVLGRDGVPEHFEIHQHNGRKTAHKEAFFGNGTIRYVDHKRGETREVKAEAVYYDVLSGFQQLRGMKIQPGSSVFLNIFDSGKIGKMEVKALRRESVETPGGNIPALVVKPELITEGLFRHEGSILIWLSDDERRLPLRVETKMAVGTVVARLVTPGR